MLILLQGLYAMRLRAWPLVALDAGDDHLLGRPPHAAAQGISLGRLGCTHRGRPLAYPAFDASFDEHPRLEIKARNLLLSFLALSIPGIVWASKRCAQNNLFFVHTYPVFSDVIGVCF